MTDTYNTGEPRGSHRLRSGIRRLDYILKGGLVAGNAYSLYGPPGSGKTIVANQICCNHVRYGDGRCVYVTLAAESVAKMIGHMESLAFYRSAYVPDRIYYVSGYGALRQGGLSELLNLLRETVHARRASLLVVDGLDTAEEAAEGPEHFREFMYELQGFTDLARCTSLLISKQPGDRLQRHNPLVDGIIELSHNLHGPRAVRELTVHKLRGSSYLPGRHEVEILDEGLVVHPRTEVQFAAPPEQAREERVRMRFGLPELDRMLEGGLLSGTATALLGAPGTGKTLLGLSFLAEGAEQGQGGVYFGFQEPPPRLIEKAESVGLDLRRHVDQGRLEIMWQAPLEHMMDSLAERLLEYLKAGDGERRRVFIDDAQGFRAAAIYRDRIPRFLSAFINQLRTIDATSLIADEVPLLRGDAELPDPELAMVVDGVIVLRNERLGSRTHRLLSITKMRESGYDTSVREFRISANGLEVAPDAASAEAALADLPPDPAGRRNP